MSKLPNLRDWKLHRGPTTGAANVIAGLTVFNGGGRRPVQRGGGVIEITFRVRFVQKTVEITKVVVRSGDRRSASRQIVTSALTIIGP